MICWRRLPSTADAPGLRTDSGARAARRSAHLRSRGRRGLRGFFDRLEVGPAGNRFDVELEDDFLADQIVGHAGILDLEIVTVENEDGGNMDSCLAHINVRRKGDRLRDA